MAGAILDVWRDDVRRFTSSLTQALRAHSTLVYATGRHAVWALAQGVADARQRQLRAAARRDDALRAVVEACFSDALPAEPLQLTVQPIAKRSAVSSSSRRACARNAVVREVLTSLERLQQVTVAKSGKRSLTQRLHAHLVESGLEADDVRVVDVVRSWRADERNDIAAGALRMHTDHVLCRLALAVEYTRGGQRHTVDVPFIVASIVRKQDDVYDHARGLLKQAPVVLPLAAGALAPPAQPPFLLYHLARRLLRGERVERQVVELSVVDGAAPGAAGVLARLDTLLGRCKWWDAEVDPVVTHAALRAAVASVLGA